MADLHEELTDVLQRHDNNRGSGRTHRMVVAAVDACLALKAPNKEAVCIIVTLSFRWEMKQLVTKELERRGLKFGTFDRGRFVLSCGRMINIALAHARIHFASFRCFEDHACLQNRMLQELRRFADE